MCLIILASLLIGCDTAGLAKKPSGDWYCEYPQIEISFNENQGVKSTGTLLEDNEVKKITCTWRRQWKGVDVKDISTDKTIFLGRFELRENFMLFINKNEDEVWVFYPKPVNESQ